MIFYSNKIQKLSISCFHLIWKELVEQMFHILFNNIKQQNMTDKQALRKSAMNDSQIYETKKRFGLFSMPISTAIGDDGPYKTKIHPKAENGKPITKARNFYSGPCKSGQLKSTFFGDINSLAASETQDEYIDPDRKLLIIENENFSKGPKNENKFMPASKTGANTLWKAPYPHTVEQKIQPKRQCRYEEEDRQKEPKRNRMQDGRVKVKPRNLCTNPGSKVITDYFKHEKHIDDPYDRAHIMEVEKMKKDKSLEKEAKFKSTNLHGKTFNKDLAIFGQDVELKEKQKKEKSYSGYKHDAKWRSSSPGKSGYRGFFTPFVYVEDPGKPIKKRPSSASTQRKENFNSMNSTLTTPTSSISGNRTNVRRAMSRSFSARKY